MDRFERQRQWLGRAGQERLGQSRVALVGCGALGGVLAQTLARAGAGTLVLIDRDVVEPSNLARQVLFTEAHARARLPKVAAARAALAAIGGPTEIEERAVHLDALNADELLEGADLVLDGSDNLATRYLLNDWAAEHGLPWIYGGVVGGRGLALLVIPGGPCLRCLWPDPPPPGSLPTCEQAGVVLPAVAAVAAVQAGLALRLLAHPEDPPQPRLVEVDVWNGRARSIAAAKDADCPSCTGHERPFLTARERPPVVLCGRNTVQVFGTGRRPDLGQLESSLRASARSVRRAGDFLRFEADELCLTVFPDGRALVEGTDEPERARAAYDRWVGR